MDASNNLLDLIEPGSGAGWDQSITDESATNNDNIINPSRVLNNQMLTPKFADSSAIDQNLDDQSPSLSRRLPVLTATAGQIWRYTIPADTFDDEDGSMRKLQSSLEFKSSFDELKNTLELTNDMDQPFDQYLHWLQYDQSSQTMVGYPTINDVGKHTYELVVADRWGQTSNLTIEILVHHHPSIRAFSHAFETSIDWNPQKYISLTKALIDIARRVTEGVYSDSSSKNFVLHSYHFPNRNSSSAPANVALTPLKIVWSNSSVPVYPCNSTQLDLILKLLVKDQYYLPNQTSSDETASSFTPSAELSKVLEPEFRVTKVDFLLLGSCRNAILGNSLRYSDTTSSREPMVRTRIQRLQWRLGQPFAFHIPDNTFGLDSDAKKSANLTLSMHTIDGIPLEDDPHYSYMEFDSDSRTLFGLPYDMKLHAGQRELLLTARNPNPEDKAARDVVIVDILNPELTTINNRAFNMSLYFISRVNSFKPRLRFDLSRKIIKSLGAGELTNNSDPSRTEFIAVEIKKFQIDTHLSSYVDHTELWAYNEKIRRVDDTFGLDQKDSQGIGESSVLYKFTWTNESIGHRGDCPVEVITENVVGALERNMFDYHLPEDYKNDDPTKNDSVRFYERLRAFFEPEIDLIFLSIGPIEGSACTNSLGYYDVGNSDLADLVTMADSSGSRFVVADYQDPITPSPKSRESPKVTRPVINSDEYWSIVVLIILVVALIFVVMMFFMGMHTYRINQEKRFELQLKLAQARQTSMYLSSMMLKDRIPNQNMLTQIPMQNGICGPGSIEDGSSRKPIILDNEKQLWADGQNDMKIFRSTAVQLNGQTVQTTPLRPNMTFTLDSIASMQNPLQLANGNPSPYINQFFIDGRKQSMTLNRRVTSESQQSRMLARQASMNQLNHSQSILTVASLSTPMQFIPHQGPTDMPVVYAPLPVVRESNEIANRGV